MRRRRPELDHLWDYCPRHDEYATGRDYNFGRAKVLTYVCGCAIVLRPGVEPMHFRSYFAAAYYLRRLHAPPRDPGLWSRLIVVLRFDHEWNWHE